MVAFIGTLLAPSAVAREPSAWDGLAESAAVKLGASARELARTANDIGAAGRIGHLTVLRSDADEVVRRAEALARMAQEPLPTEAPPPPKPAPPKPARHRR